MFLEMMESLETNNIFDFSHQSINVGSFLLLLQKMSPVNCFG